MKHFTLFTACLTLIFMLLCGTAAKSQTFTDELLMPSGDLCVYAAYDYGSFHQYWEGSMLRENQTIATLRRSTAFSMAAIGIFDRLNLLLAVPYVKTRSSEPNGGHLAGAQGFQDIALALKYAAIQTPLARGEFSALAAVGFSTPMSNYLSDFMPYSLGFGAPELSWRGILHYQAENGAYMRASAAYLWRGYTEAERDYYYNNGSYYTAWMDVPSAWNFEGVIGAWLLGRSLRAELSYVGLKSTSGDDIRAYNAPQPTNKVKFDRAGLFLHYYFPFIQGLGVVAYHNRVFNGLNAPKINNSSLGISYQFAFLKKQK